MAPICLGKPVPVLSYPHSEEVFFDVQMEPSMSQFLAIDPGPCHQAPLKEAWLPLLCTLTSDIHTYGRDLPEPSLHHPSFDSLRYDLMALVWGSPLLDAVHLYMLSSELCK